MPGMSDIIRDSIVDFSRLHDLETYELMYKRYIELKVILTTAGVNLTELDKVKE